jgi:hypothetical protein
MGNEEAIGILGEQQRDAKEEKCDTEVRETVHEQAHLAVVAELFLIRCRSMAP